MLRFFKETKRLSQAIPTPKPMGFFGPRNVALGKNVYVEESHTHTHKSSCMSERNQGTAKLGSAGRPIFWLSTSTLTTICMVLFHVAS